MFNIRPYKASDYGIIKEWWQESNEVPPLPDMMPEDSSFVLEYENEPLVAITLYLTNSSRVAWIDNLIGKPGIDRVIRKAGVQRIVRHTEEFAKEKGYKSTFCFSEKGKLISYYQSLGYMPTLSNVTTLIKEI